MDGHIKIQYIIISGLALCMVAASWLTIFSSNASDSIQAIPRASTNMIHPGAASSRVINHTCTNYHLIPASWLDQVKALNFNVHYAHTSHGGQLTTGLDEIQAANATFAELVESSSITPDATNFNIFDGQGNATFSETYITPDLYWQTTPGLDLTRYVLHHNSINVSMWMWCTQLDSYSTTDVQQSQLLVELLVKIGQGMHGAFRNLDVFNRSWHG